MYFDFPEGHSDCLPKLHKLTETSSRLKTSILISGENVKHKQQKSTFFNV